MKNIFASNLKSKSKFNPSSIFKYFPPPEYIGMPHVGFDITVNSVKYAELLKSPKGLKLGRFGTQDLPSPLVFNENLASNQDLLAIIKKLQRNNKFNFVEVSIP